VLLVGVRFPHIFMALNTFLEYRPRDTIYISSSVLGWKNTRGNVINSKMNGILACIHVGKVWLW